MSELKVEVKRVINSPIDRVFKAWIEPEQMKQWYSPEGMTTPEATVEPHTGGSYSVTMKMGEQEFNMGGKYLEVDSPHKLVFTWNDEASVVSVEFKELEANKTEVILKHVGFIDNNSRNQHDEGWVGTFNKLARYFKS